MRIGTINLTAAHHDILRRRSLGYEIRFGGWTERQWTLSHPEMPAKRVPGEAVKQLIRGGLLRGVYLPRKEEMRLDLTAAARSALARIAFRKG